jgi:hypothetical protein
MGVSASFTEKQLDVVHTHLLDGFDIRSRKRISLVEENGKKA